MNEYEEVKSWTNDQFEFIDQEKRYYYDVYYIIKCKKCGTVFSRERRGIRDRAIRCPGCYTPKCESYLKKLNRKQIRENELSKVKHCVICGNEFRNSDARRKTCSTECANTLKKANHGLKRFRHKGGAIIDYGITLQRVYDRDKGRCWLCGELTDFNDILYTKDGHKYCGPKHPVKDHIVPIARGGDESWENIKLACWKCNKEKSDALIDIDKSTKSRKIIVSDRCGEKDGSIPIAQYKLDGSLVKVYKSMSQASRETGIAECQIAAVRNGRQKTAHGFIWKTVTANNVVQEDGKLSV